MFVISLKIISPGPYGAPRENDIRITSSITIFPCLWSIWKSFPPAHTELPGKMISEFLPQLYPRGKTFLKCKVSWTYCKPVTYLWGFSLEKAGKLGVSLDKAALLKPCFLPSSPILAKYPNFSTMRRSMGSPNCSPASTTLLEHSHHFWSRLVLWAASMNLFLEQSKIQAVPYNMADDILVW